MDLNIESDEFEAGEIAREYAVQEALSTALARAEQQTQELQLHRDVVSHTVECCMQSCITLGEMTFVSRETQPLDPDPLSESSWQSDAEPLPCAPDTWMRGVIQIKKPQQRQTSSISTGDKGSLSPSKNTLRRTGSTRSIHTAASPRISKDLSRNSSRVSNESFSGRDEQAASSTLLKKDTAAGRLPAGKAGLGAQHGSAKKGPQHEVEERLREEVAIRKKEQQRHAEMLAKEEEDQQKFEALHKQLRGKDYGYDHKGQIVVINAVDPDNLPPLAPAPAVSTSPGEKKQRQNLAPKPKDPVAEAPKPKVRASLETDGPDFIADKKEVQPPVAESIRLASGISLRSGAAVQSGPKRIVDLDHMTKRDHAKYLAKAAAENAVTLTGTKGTKGSRVPSDSLPNGRLQPQGSMASKMASSAAQVNSTAVQPLKQRMQQQQPQAAVTMSSVAMLTQVSEGEELKWARDGVPKKIAAKTVERPLSPVDPNLALLSDSSWGLTAAVKGRSPAQLPAKEAVAAGKCPCCQVLAVLLYMVQPDLWFWRMHINLNRMYSGKLVAADVPMLKLRDRTFKRGQIASIPVAPGLRLDKATPHVDAYGGSLGWSQ